jgi:hypothetical protein
MSSLGWDLDGRLTELELEWRLAYDDSIAARAHYQRLTSKSRTSVEDIDLAREKLEQAEAVTAAILAKIERLENRLARGG